MDSQRRRRGHDFLPTDELLSQIPGAYGSQNVPAEDKTIWLHYFSAASDHYLAEVWREPGEQGEPGQWMAFGYARLAAFPEGAEWGYISLDELEQLRVQTPDGLPVIVERDLHWEPGKFSQITEAHTDADLADRYERVRGAERQAGRTLTLDPEQAATIIAALQDAAVLRREPIGYCLECSTQESTRPCADHKGSRQTANEYDALRWQLEAAAGNPGYPRPDVRQAERYEPPEVPDTAQAASPEVANIIADHARAVNRPASGPDGGPHVPPEDAVPFEARGRHGPSASYAEWLAEGQADPGPAERQLEDWNIHNDHADRLEPDYPEAGD